MIIKANFRKGFAKINIQNLDDLWTLSQVISPGDFLKGKTKRRITVQKGARTESVKKTVFVKIEIKEVEFHKYSNVLRVSGIVLEGPEDVELHSHHTFNLEIGTEIKIEKEFAGWEIKKLKKAQESSKNPQVLLAVVEEGVTEIALVKEYGLDFLGRLHKNIPGKKDENFEKRRSEYYVHIAKELERIAEERKLNMVLAGGNVVVIASLKKSLSKGTKIKTVHISSTSRSGIHEMLKRGYVEELSKDLRFAHEARIIEELLARMGKKSKVALGIKEVEEKILAGAVELLLLTDNLLVKSRQDGTYKNLENLMKTCEKLGGEVDIISTEHEYGEKLKSLRGIAALLRY